MSLDRAAISLDGRYIAFVSPLDLSPSDGNGQSDVYVFDQETELFMLASADAAGAAGPMPSASPAINDDGQLVVLTTQAALVSTDTNQRHDVFMRDLVARSTERISLTSQGQEALTGESGEPDISPDGRYVTFVSSAFDLDPADSDPLVDVYLHDRLSAGTSLVSTSSVAKANAESHWPVVTLDGKVIFTSLATNLVAPSVRPGQIFLHDSSLGSTEVLSRTASGMVASEGNNFPRTTPTADLVAFVSFAQLVDSDTNAFPDVYSRDRINAASILIGPPNMAGDDLSSHPDLSNSGNRIVFESRASNLVSGDSGALDVFLRIRGETGFLRITQDYTGPNPDADPLIPRISGDGCFVVFGSKAPNLDPNDVDSERDLFVGCLCGP